MEKERIKDFLLDVFFPKFCFGCQKEGEYLCEDCRETLEIFKNHLPFSSPYLSDLYFPLEYKNPLLKKLIVSFKYSPFVKELAKDLSFLIIQHFLLLEKMPDFSEFYLLPIPLTKRRMRWRGFNQAEEIAKELAKFLKIPLIREGLLRTRDNLPQVELGERERRENIKGVFQVKEKEAIFGKKILLVDDIYTTGATMEEAAKVLKEAGAKKIIGLCLAKASPGEDKISGGGGI